MAFQEDMEQKLAPFSAFLQDWVKHLSLEQTIDQNSDLMKAMAHGLLAGGKRFRPYLVLETGRLFDVPQDQMMPVGLSLELIHTYSLIHDDLPAMDDDLLRRGQPTVWHKYDEATAILAGDGLLTYGLQILSEPKLNIEAEIKLMLINLIADAAGAAGMVGGQALDLAFEKIGEDKTRGASGLRTRGEDKTRGASGLRTRGEAKKAKQEELLSEIHKRKTGALIKASVLAGGLLGKADQSQMKALEIYGAQLGLAFQISDDLLDVTGVAEELGKTPGKDASSGKLTFVALYGLEGAKDRLQEVIDKGSSALDEFGPKAEGLKNAINFMGARMS